MNEQLLELALKKISLLEKKIEKYYSILKINNELDFIINGGYLIDSELENVINGDY